jgi:Icc-related predicted phosphoesterase
MRTLATIAATGDIHSPKFLDDFRIAMRSVESSTIDLFLLAGDLILRGGIENLASVLAVFDDNGICCPIIGCFGNEEYSEIRDQMKVAAGNRIKFLDDSSASLQVGSLNIGIVGSQGSLDLPTPWQAENIPGIEEVYSQRISRLSGILGRLVADVRILLTHYPPTYRVLKGERRTFYPYIGSQKCERILAGGMVTFAVCAHAHMGIPFAVAKGVPVYNVSLPVAHRITLIDVKEPIISDALRQE